MIRNLGAGLSLTAGFDGESVVPTRPQGTRQHAVTSSYTDTRQRVLSQAREKWQTVEADYQDGGMGGPGGQWGHSGFGMTGAGNLSAYIMSVIERFLPETPYILRRLYRDIYFNDPIGGAAVDLLSNMPWSDFTITGMPKASMVYPFDKSISNVGVKSMLPELSVDYMVLGNHVGVLNFDSRENVFTAYLPQDIESCDIIEVPVNGIDPLINLKVTKQFERFLEYAKKDQRAARALRLLPEFMRQSSSIASASRGNQKVLKLNPSNTLFVPRRTFSTMQIGTSYYRRLLAIYLWEKAMLTGTIESSYRRQRGILHITMGDDEWEPSDDEMRAMSNLFISADLDPTGAIVVTRQGVVTEDVRCLDGESLLSTIEGLVPISSLVDHDPDTLAPGTSFSIDLTVRGADGLPVRAVEWHYQGKMPVREHIIESGAFISCTDKHKVLKLSEEAALELVPIGDVGKSFICLERNGFRQNTPPLLLDVPLPEVAKQGNHDITYPEFMTPDLAYLCGLIVTDGSMSDSTVFFHNTNKGLHSKFRRLIKNVFNKTIKTRQIKDHGVSIIKGVAYNTIPLHSSEVNSVGIVKFLQSIGVEHTVRLRERHQENSPSYHKKVPWSVLQADRDSRLSFIAGFIDGDGSILNRKHLNRAVEIVFNSRSVHILRAINVLLSDMGYHSSIRYGEYRVTVQTSEADRLYNDLLPYLWSIRKRPHKECNSRIFKHYGIPPCAFLPLLKSRYVRRAKAGGCWFIDDDNREVFVEGGWGTIFRHFKHVGTYMLYERYDEGAYIQHMNVIKQVSKRLYRNMLHLFKIRPKFERIVRAGKTMMKHTYDLTIEKGKPPLFVVNGFVVKNSGEDFWKYSDIVEVTSSVKLNSLGINASFLDGTSSYNCVVGDTLIATEQGIFRIDNMGDKQGPRIQTIDIKVASRTKPEKAATWHRNGKQPTIEVKTDSGNDNTVTPGHPFLVLREGRHVKVAAKDLHVGDLLCFNPRQITRKKPLRLNLSQAIEAVDFWSKRPTQYVRPTNMTPNLAWLIGALVAEGNVNSCKGRTLVQFSNTNETLLSNYRSLIQSLFGADVSYGLSTRSGEVKTFGVSCGRAENTEYAANYDCWQATTYSRVLCVWLKELGLFVKDENTPIAHSYASKKDVPWSILQADEESQLAFLGAYLDCDGSVLDKEGLRWFSKSQDVLRKIQVMLNAHGVWCRRSRHRVQVDRCWVGDFWTKIQPYVLTKSFAFEKTDKTSNIKGFPMNHIRDFIRSRKVRKARGPEQRGFIGIEFKTDSGSSVVLNWNDNRDIITRKYMTYDAYKRGDYDLFLSKLRIISKSEHAALLQLLKCEYVYPRIISLKKGKRQEVYDLSVNEPLNKSMAQRVVEFRQPWFVINGIIASNTLEQAMSSFLEQIRAYREMISRRIFYNKLFPAIAIANDFGKSRKERLELTGSLKGHDPRVRQNPQTGLYEIDCDGNRAPDITDMDLTDYHIPKINWHKSLKPEADASYLDMLNTIEAKGVPVPLRLWAVASGLSLTECLASMDEDLVIRRQVQDYNKRKPKTPGAESQEMVASLLGDYDKRILTSGRKKNRQFPEIPVRDPETKRALSVKGGKVQTEKLHVKAAAVAANLHARQNHIERERQRRDRQRSYSIPRRSGKGTSSIFGVTS